MSLSSAALPLQSHVCWMW